jgi:hypothetical protein
MTQSTEPSPPFAKLGQEQTEAMAGMQKEILDAYEQANRAWLARVKSEVEFWSDLASKLSATRSVPEAMETYQKSAAHRMQMAAEDGRRLTEDYQKIMHKFSGSLSNGWPTKST